MKLKKILIAEDDLHIAKLIEFKLKQKGLEVVLAKNGDEAKAFFLSAPNHWDAILLDVMMPGCDGWEVLKFIRSHPEAAETPIVMLTARGQTSDDAQAKQLGASHLLRKPFDPSELIKILGESLHGLE